MTELEHEMVEEHLKSFIEKQEALIDKMIIDKKTYKKQALIRDIVYIVVIGIIIGAFILCYWFSDNGYKYNNSINNVENSQEVQIGDRK